MKELKAKSIYRKFVFKLIMLTTCVSICVLVPALVIFFISVANINDSQVMAFLTAVLITAVVDFLLALFWEGYLLRPLGKYVSKHDKGVEIENDLQVIVRERLNSLTVLRSYGIIFQWLAGLLAVSVVVPIMAGITFDQLLYLWVSGSLAMVAAYVLYTLVTTKLLEKYISTGIFDKTNQALSLKTKTWFGSLIPSISAALLAICILMEVALIATAIKIGHNSIVKVYSENLLKTNRQIELQLTYIYQHYQNNAEKYVRNFINKINADNNEVVSVFRTNGVPITQHKLFKTKNIKSLDWGQQFVATQKEVLSYSVDGKEIIGSSIINKKYNFISLISIPKSAINVNSSSMSVWMILLGVIALLFASFMAFRYVKKMISPIKECHRVLGNVAFGDFRNDIQILSGDEIGMLASSISILIEKIKEVVKDGIQISYELANSSQELSGSTLVVSENAQSEAASIEQITASIEEISAGMGNISYSAEEQFGSLVELNIKMTDLSNIITKMGVSIDDTVRVTGKIKTLSQTGGESLDKMNSIMEEIIGSSKSMITVVNIITGISEQINLLSLNASIEAARAGDAGRGFAVVSDEISKLADQTAHSIKEIDSLIKKNTSDVNSGFSQIKGTTEVLQSIIEGVNFIAERMTEFSDMTRGQLQTNTLVLGQVDNTKDRAEEIKISTEEQKVATSEISKSVNNMNALTQSYATGSEEIAGTAESIASMSDILMHRMEFFKV